MPSAKSAKKSVSKKKPLPEPAAEWVPIGELKAWPDNPRRNDGRPVNEVVRSIKRFGFGAPILARRENREVIAGHTRLKAALELRMPKVPVRYLDLDPDEAHLLALADNRVGELADWDDDRLGNLLRTFDADGVDLDSLGWTENELADLLTEADSPHIDAEGLYTDKIAAPIYEPTGDQPGLDELADQTKTEQLRADIATADLPDEVRAFLHAAAGRHTVFRYDRIAEWYCHASADVQRLMERSALVIVDIGTAIEGGFVQMSEEIAALYDAEERNE